MTDQHGCSSTIPACAPSPGNAQWIGARQDQQDSFGFAGFDERGEAGAEGVLAVVADGMGGMTGGRAASQAAVRTFLATWGARPASQPLPEALNCAMQAANRAVYDLATATVGEGETGTTLVAAAVRAGQFYWIATGDSRLYLYRAVDGSLTSCNEEHNYALNVWRQAPADGPAPDWIARDPDRDALTSFLGMAQIPELDRNVRGLGLQPGDRLLLCSDGVDGVLSQQELAAGVVGNPQSAAEGIIARLQQLKRPHQDNATVAILACPGAPPSPDVLPAQAPAAAPLAGARLRWPPAWARAYGVAGLALVLLVGGVGAWFVWGDGTGPGPSSDTAATGSAGSKAPPPTTGGPIGSGAAPTGVAPSPAATESPPGAMPTLPSECPASTTVTLAAAEAALKDNNLPCAIKLFEVFANRGNVAAQVKLGDIYSGPRDADQLLNAEQAVYWYRKAADQGNPAAQTGLGWMYAAGDGVPRQDEAEAVRWFQKAADKGFAEAQRSLGTMYLEGRGVKRSKKDAIDWFRKAAKQGHAKAKAALEDLEDKSR